MKALIGQGKRWEASEGNICKYHIVAWSLIQYEVHQAMIPSHHCINYRNKSSQKISVFNDKKIALFENNCP